MNLLLPRVPDRRERHLVVLSRRQVPQGVRSQLPIGQEAAPGIQPSGHVNHEAVWDVSRVAAPGDQRRGRSHVCQGEVLRGQGPWGGGTA